MKVSQASIRLILRTSKVLSDGNILNLASLLGRSMDTISTYVQQLSRDSDLVKAVSII